ncbi:hypothetical protein VTK56DRAFT_225 [Thermocarpiscus australiensis]
MALAKMLLDRSLRPLSSPAEPQAGLPPRMDMLQAQAVHIADTPSSPSKYESTFKSDGDSYHSEYSSCTNNNRATKER